MSLRVDVLADPSGKRPPAGTRVRVQLRDTSLADAPATIVAEAAGVVGDRSAGPLATVELPAGGAGLTVWAHAEVSGTSEVSVGDYLTMQSFPAPSAEQQPARIVITVRAVR